MNAQEIFDTVARHLFTQGHPAITTGNGCRYRGDNGASCAVGCVLPDEYYNSDDMEGLAIDSLVELGVNLPQWMADNEELLRSLQSVHDNRATLDDKYDPVPFDRNILHSDLLDVAEAFNLNTDVLKEFE